MTDDLEFKVRLLALKKAAIVMDTLAKSMKDQSVRNETDSLTWSITWAVSELEKYHAQEQVRNGSV